MFRCSTCSISTNVAHLLTALAQNSKYFRQTDPRLAAALSCETDVWSQSGLVQRSLLAEVHDVESDLAGVTELALLFSFALLFPIWIRKRTKNELLSHAGCYARRSESLHPKLYTTL